MDSIKKYPNPGVLSFECPDCKHGPKDLQCPALKLTDDSQAHDCDINVIVDRFHKTGVMPGHDPGGAFFDDFSTPFDFHAAQNVLAHATQQFAALDAKTRARFGNDPAQFLEFAHDPESGPELVKLGLATKRKPEPVTPLPAAPEGTTVKPDASGAKAPKAPKAPPASEAE